MSGTELLDFLTARIDADEEVARMVVVEPTDPGMTLWVIDDDFRHNTLAVDAHRVLAEVAMKRALIANLFAYEAKIDGEWGCCHTAEQIRAGQCESIPVNEIEGLRGLALPYAQHRDYRSVWRPSPAPSRPETTTDTEEN